MQITYSIIDCKKTRIELKKKISVLFPIFICVSESLEYEESMNSVLKYSPHIVFLNVDDSISGSNESPFSFINELYNYQKSIPSFIALSVTKNHAYTAIKNNFLDYIVKPISEFELRKALLRFQTNQPFNSPRLCLKSYKDYRFIDTDELLFLKADNNSTDFFLNDGRKISAFKTLKNFEELLPENFVRIHNSYIINVNYVSRINFGKSKCSIKSDHSIPFSRSYKENVELLKDSLSQSSVLSLN
ncbi:MAG: LytTR family transcriptional regulator DNA-binding domain-containing protein [Flavobacteriaceae bacterium]|nr:LytTR family transcriptional regulator DNA-binding domain-containing protein [Flavobacteriaceae bacterium]